MKKFSKFTSLMSLILTLSVLLCSFSGCDLVLDPPEDGTIAADVGKPTEQSSEKSTETDASGETKLQKEYCTATADGDFVSDKILIKLFPEYEKIEYTVEDFANIGCISLKDNTPSGDRIKCYIMELDKKSRENVILQIKELEKREDIYSASPIYGFAFDLVPSDYNANFSMQWAIEKLQLPDAWDITTGSSTISVGVIDTGIDITHPDLANRVDRTLSKSYIDGSSALEDNDGHGTHVAGIIGAQWNNEESNGAGGVCWNVKLVSLKVSNDSDYINEENIADAIRYAQEKGIQILNLSASSGTEYECVKTALESYTGLIVCSAGNKNSDNDQTPRYPTNYSYDNLISVAASDMYDSIWVDIFGRGASNYGATTVDLFAPGDLIYSCSPNENKRYVSLDGTSMATPFVAGVAALMMANNSNLSPARIKQLILDNVDEVSNFSGKCVSGGRLNAYKAVNASSHNCDYTYRYVSVNLSTHKAYCACGYYTLEYHSNGNDEGPVIRCTKCGYGLELWSIDPPVTSQKYNLNEYK